MPNNSNKVIVGFNNARERYFMGLFRPNIEKLEEEGKFNEIAKQLKNRNVEIRLKAFLTLIKKLNSTQDPMYAKLRAMMDDPDSGIRTIAVLKFAEMGEEGLFTKVHSIIIDGSPREKIDALRILAKTGKTESEAISNVLVLAMNDKKPLVELEAIKTMGILRDRLCIKHLVEKSQDNRHTIRIESIKSLGLIGGEEVVNPLIGALMDNNTAVRRAAREALESIDSEKAKKSLNDAPLMLLVKLMNESMSRRLETINYIGKQKRKDGIPLLQKACSDEYKNIRIEAIRSIGILRDRDSVPLITRMLNDPYFDVRLEAVKTLEKLGGEDAQIALEKALNDQNSNVRKEASRAFYALKARYVNQSDE
ncbi:MAG TPA: HEAT repeat domain-containing protein [Spirochaetota bacterium]|nr:HEAT repeat domain-containing protein [Spirochaetota bacterium]